LDGGRHYPHVDGAANASTPLTVNDVHADQVAVPIGGPPANHTDVQLNFTVMVAAHTIDDKTGPGQPYFDEADAGWTFNGSGNISKKGWAAIGTPGNLITGNYSTVGKAAGVDLAPTTTVTPVLGQFLSNDTLNFNNAMNKQNGSRFVLEQKNSWT
jgi:hypothetical protein